MRQLVLSMIVGGCVLATGCSGGPSETADDQAQPVTSSRGPSGTNEANRGARTDVTHVEASAAAGEIPHSSWVSDGVYHYEIPIQRPDGVNGMAPTLSLEYESKNFVDVMGIGWRINGTSSIRRCAHSFARDGVAQPMEFNKGAYNQLCIGDKRLVEVSRLPSTDSSTHPSTTYETNDHDGVKYVAMWDKTKFTDDPYEIHAIHPDGRVFVYGGDTMAVAAARPRSAGALLACSDPMWVYAWNLYQVVDATGLNAVTYLYDYDTVWNEQASALGACSDHRSTRRLLSEVKYADITLSFEYANREMPVIAYDGGFDVSSGHRLAAVKVKRGNAPIWYYSLSYGLSPLTQREELKNVMMLDAQGNALPSLRFTWNNDTAAEIRAADLTTTSEDLTSNQYTIDSQPVGASDCSQCGSVDNLVWDTTGAYSALKQGQAVDWSTYLPTQPLVVGDINADGFDDVALIGSKGIAYWTGGPAGLNQKALTRATPSPTLAAALRKVANVVDLENAGYPQLVLNDGTVYDGRRDALLTVSDAPRAGYSNLFSFFRNWTFADMTGDGKVDFVGMQPKTVPCGSDPNAGDRAFLHIASDDATLADKRFAGGGPTLSWAPCTSYAPVNVGKFGVMSPQGWDPAIARYVGMTNKVMALRDLDGDGRSEPTELAPLLMAVPNGPSTAPSHTMQWQFLGDFNGDGTADTLRVEPQNAAQVFCGKGGYRFGLSRSFGDGRAAEDHGQNNFGHTFPSNVSTCPAPTAYAPTDSSYMGAPRMDGNLGVLVGDFNGDGKDDSVLLQTEVNWSNEKGPVISTPNRPQLLLSALRRSGSTYGPLFSVVGLPDGAGTPHFRVNFNGYVQETWKSGTTDLGDIVAAFASGGWSLLRGPLSSTLPDKIYQGAGAGNWALTRTGDFNGDGIADVVQIALEATAGLVVDVIRLKTTDLPLPLEHRHDVITKIESGGTTITSSPELIEYDDLPRMAKSGRYTLGADTELGQTVPTYGNVRRGLVVKSLKPEHRKGSSITSDNSIAYSYSGLRFLRATRTPIGFATTTVRDNAVGIEETEARTWATADVPAWFLKDSLTTAPSVPWLQLDHPDTAATPSAQWMADRPIVTIVNSNYLVHTTIPFVKSIVHATTRSNLLRYNMGGLSNEPREVTTDVQNFDLNAEGRYDGTAVDGFNVFFDATPARSNGATAKTHELTVYEGCTGSSACSGSTSTLRSTTVIKQWDSVARRAKQTETTLFDTSSVSATPTRTIVDLTTTTFRNDTNAWILARPEKQVVTRTLYDRASSSSSQPNGTFLSQETRVSSSTYDAYGRVDTVTAAPNDAAAPTNTDEILTTTYGYDTSHGNVSKIDIRGYDGQSLLTRTVTFDYDSTGVHPIRMTRNGTFVTTFAWDPLLGVKTAEVDERGVGVDLVYDGFGRQVGSVSDLGPASRAILYSVGSTNALGVRMQVAVDTATCPGTVWNGRCMVDATKVERDIQGRVVLEARRALGGTWWYDTTKYDDPRGLPSEVRWDMLDPTAPPVAYNVSYSFDGLGRRSGVVIKDTRTESIGYMYPDQFTVAVTKDKFVNSARELRKVVHDPAGDVLTSSDDMGTTSFVRDALGELREANVGSLKHAYTYDHRGRVLTDTQGSGSRWTKLTYEYNAFGEVRHQVRTGATPDSQDGSATQVDCSAIHDAFARVGSRTCTTSFSANGSAPAGTFSESESYVYNGSLNRLETATSSAPNGAVVTQTFGYDTYSRVTSQSTVTPSSTLTVSNTYDGVGNPGTVTYPTLGAAAALVVKYGYEPSTGMLISAKAGTTNLWSLSKADPTTIIETSYDGVTSTTSLTARQITRIEHGNLAQPLQPGRRIDYAYDPLGRIQTTSSTEGATAKTSIETFDYDLASRVGFWSTTPTNQASGYTLVYDYEPSGALKKVRRYTGAVAAGSAPPSWTPTNTTTYAANNELGQLTLATDTASATPFASVKTNYRYDFLGRRASTTSTNKAETIDYDHFDLPTTIRGGTSLTALSAVATFLYDAFGHRVRAVDPGASLTTNYAGGALFEDRVTGSGSTAQHDYVSHVMVAGREVLQVTQSFTGTTLGSTTYVTLHADRKGSTVASVSGSAWTHRYYEPFGAAVDTGFGPVARDPKMHVGFNGTELDATGYINQRGRMYDPKTRQFLTRDPIVQGNGPQAWNHYAFVHNDPANRTDPTGFADEGEGGLLGELTVTCETCPQPSDPEAAATPDPPATDVPPTHEFDVGPWRDTDDEGDGFLDALDRGVSAVAAAIPEDVAVGKLEEARFGTNSNGLNLSTSWFMNPIGTIGGQVAAAVASYFTDRPSLQLLAGAVGGGIASGIVRGGPRAIREVDLRLSVLRASDAHGPRPTFNTVSAPANSPMEVAFGTGFELLDFVGKVRATTYGDLYGWGADFTAANFHSMARDAQWIHFDLTGVDPRIFAEHVNWVNQVGYSTLGNGFTNYELYETVSNYAYKTTFWRDGNFVATPSIVR